MFSFEERVIASCLRSGHGKPRQRNLKQSLYPWNRLALSHVPNTGSAPRPFTYLCGGLDGDRTHDLLFRRQTLYPLSYKPVRQPTLHCLEMKATLFTEKWSLNLSHYVGKVSMVGFRQRAQPCRGFDGCRTGNEEYYIIIYGAITLFTASFPLD